MKRENKVYLESLKEFLQKYQLNVNDLEKIKQAFTHKSYAYERSLGEFHNERLEFLGDAVIELVITEYLFEKYPNIPEGQLTRWRSATVNAKRLASVARKLKLDRFLLLSKSSERSGDRKQVSILADVYESLVGALYLQIPLKELKRFILQTLDPDSVQWSDPKSELQEFTQGHFKKIPQYRVLKTYGPQHKRRFVVEVEVRGRKFGPAEGGTKKEAEQAAAKLALDYFRKEGQLAG